MVVVTPANMVYGLPWLRFPLRCWALCCQICLIYLVVGFMTHRMSNMSRWHTGILNLSLTYLRNGILCSGITWHTNNLARHLGSTERKIHVAHKYY